MLRICATGDSILLDAIPEEYDAISSDLQSYIRSADVRLANMETTLSDFDVFPSTYCGGTWLTAKPGVLNELDRFAFQHYSFANNHTMDYSYGGMFSTLRAIEEHGVLSSGAGNDLNEAAKPAVIRTENGSVGVITLTATCDDSARAGYGRECVPGRPGVNMLRHKEIFAINHERMEKLKEIARNTYINGRIDNSKRGGYTVSEPGIFNLGQLRFVEDENEGKRSIPNEADCRRTEQGIREALQEVDQVIIFLHSHEIKGATDDEPDYFLETFARRCIDAGAHAVICSGTHQIKAIEMYKGAPIFYSIANFIFQSDHEQHLPKDFYEKYSVDLSLDAKGALNVRSAGGTRGLQTDVNNYLGLVPTLTFEGGKLQKIVIQPVELCFEEKYALKGLPRKATGKALEKICERLRTLSAPYGTEFTEENGLLEVRLG